MRKVCVVIVSLLLLATVAIYTIGLGWYGDAVTAGSIEGAARSGAAIDDRIRRVSEGQSGLGENSGESILKSVSFELI